LISRRRSSLKNRHFTALALVLGCVAAALAIACSGSDDTPKSNQASSSASASASSQDVSKLADNFAALKSFRATISAGGAGGLEGKVEYEAPGKVHVTAGSGSVTQEIFCFGSTFYVKPQGSTWQTAPPGANCRANLGPADPDAIAASLRAVPADKLTKGSEDSVGGKKCTVYTGSLPSGVEFGVCVADGLPLRIINKNAQGAVTLTFSDFDQPLDLKSPI
jgi:hypothetical protein